jgi:glycolate oxidase iron-sulfur subunit
MDCIHCGLCLSHCPTYAENGQEADSPRGRIYLMRALYEGRLEPTPDVTEHLDLCLGCRACETACPSGVQYGYLIEGTRAHLRETNVPKSPKEKLILKAAEMSFPYPERLSLLLTPIRILRRTGILPLMRRLGVMKLFGYLGDLEMLLPPLPPAGKRHAFPERWSAKGEKQASVGMLTGCVMPVMLTQVNESTARVLARAGCEVAAPKSQNCCGAMHAHTGAMDEAKRLAKRNMEAFEAWEAEHGPLEAIIVNAAGCGSALKEYPQWFHGDEEWEARAKRFSAKVKDVSEYLAQPRFKSRLAERMTAGRGRPEPIGYEAAQEGVPNTTGATSVQGGGIAAPQGSAEQVAAGRPEGIFPAHATRKRKAGVKVTYHDACHLAHGQGIRVPPRELLAMIPDIKMIPLGESEMCCGSAGTYNITQPTMALQLLERKMKNIEATGARTCVTGNPGCAMQLMLGAKKFGPQVEIKHPIELLDEATR